MMLNPLNPGVVILTQNTGVLYFAIASFVYSRGNAMCAKKIHQGFLPLPWWFSGYSAKYCTGKSR